MSDVQTLQDPQTGPFFGERLDSDGHVYLEPDVMARVLGDLGSDPMADYLKKYFFSEEDRKNRERNRSELWSIKGPSALGASDPTDRLEALNAMGMRSQLVFQNSFSRKLRMDSPAAREACRRYNDYVLAWSELTGGRTRPGCLINMGDRAWALQEVERVAAKGAKHITLPCASPPAGVSPAHSSWDPFWGLVQDLDLAMTLHLGGGGMITGKDPDPMIPAREWGNAEGLKLAPAARPGGEEAISPYFMMVAHVPAEIYLQVMVMGGVFERFPRLRLGIIEYGAGWVGPAVERMDHWAGFLARVGGVYPMKPSEYMTRNVRVAPFFYENLPRLIDRYGMEDIYVFSTDFPHLEGSRDPIGKFQKWLDQMDPSYARKFYIDNPKLLFPGL